MINMFRRHALPLGIFAVMFLISPFRAEAQLYPINPFSGVVTESFSSFAPGFLTPPLTIMNGAASVQTTATIGSSSPLNHYFSVGDSSANALNTSVVAADGTNFLGVENGLGLGSMDIVFTNTVKAFGGYWGATSDSNSIATLTFTFFDAGNQQVGPPQAVTYFRASGDGVLEWHGWFSSTPFKKVTITGSGSTVVGDSFRAGLAGFSVITSISPVTATKYILQGAGTTGVVFSVQGNTNLMTTNWVTLGTAPADVTGALRFTNTTASPQQFYRLQAP